MNIGVVSHSTLKIGGIKMKVFDVFYDVKVNGLLEERCITVYGALTRVHAINEYKKQAPKGAIFRSVKKPLSFPASCS